MSDEICYEVDSGIGWITLNRPQARNALTFAMYDRVAEICSDIEAHGSPKVLVLTGAGEKAFVEAIKRLGLFLQVVAVPPNRGQASGVN